MPPNTKVEQAVSAGGVVYRRDGHEFQVLLCGWHTSSSWVLPKGTPDPGESLEQTALREVREETGIEVVIQDYIGHTRYWFTGDEGRVRYHKTVHFYLMKPVGGELSLHDPEFDIVQWFPAREALKVMSYANDVRIIKKALTMIRAESTQ